MGIEAKTFKYHGRTYRLDTLSALRLTQKMLTDSEARFSRGDRSALSAILEPLIFQVAAVEQDYEEREHARQQHEDRKDSQEYKIPRFLYDVSLHQTELAALLWKLRQPGSFPLNDILTEGDYGPIPVTVDSHVTVLFDDTDTVQLRVFLKGDVLPKTELQAHA